MAEIIKAIVAVKFWQMKMLNEDYIKIWKKDLKNKYNISERIVDVALAMLYDQHYEKHDDFDYPWHLRIGVDSSIWSGCNKGCECMICSEEEYLPKQLTEYDQDSEDYRNIQNQLKKYSKISCKCQNSWVDDNLVFLRNNIYHQMKLIPNDLKQRFMTHVTAFEARKTDKDFHPHSNDQMLDIIHPSLYCFVRAITPVTEEAKPLLRYSSQLQWIPAEFSVIRDESSNLPIRTEIRSSINNLDRNNPLNTELYQDIAEIFTFMVPGFEKILNKLKEDDRILALQGSSHPLDDIIQLKDCKVIVKIASTLVNAEKPEFKEGSWHLEGVHSEMIIATGIYYYDVKNIKQSYLRFRTTMKNEYLNYPQNCHEYVHLHYGLKLTKFDDPDSIQYNESAANSLVKLGRIPTKEDMCLFFPNFLQHRVSNVCLEDGATEGHRSILVFFLINPFGRVISSSDIPVSPQETMTLEEAKLCRELLMFERQYEYTPQDQFHQRLISLCEH